MALNPSEAATLVMDKLRCTQAEADAAVAAAVEYVGGFTGFDVLTDDPEDLDPFPQLTLDGVVLLGCRIFQDTPLPSGSLSSFDETFGGGIPGGTPRWLSAHLDQYFNHLDRQFGLA